MKMKQLYVCELCHTEKDNAKGFPIRVVLTSADGSTAIYRYEGDAKS